MLHSLFYLCINYWLYFLSYYSFCSSEENDMKTYKTSLFVYPSTTFKSGITKTRNVVGGVVEKVSLRWVHITRVVGNAIAWKEVEMLLERSHRNHFNQKEIKLNSTRANESWRYHMCIVHWTRLHLFILSYKFWNSWFWISLTSFPNQY